MARDTYSEVWNRVLLRAADLSPSLAQDLVSNAFREVAERRRWSWLWRFGQFVMPAVYSTGTVSATQGSPTITGSGTSWTPSMVGRQFRSGGSNPVYTIQQYNSTTSLTLDLDWGPASISAQTYEIWQAYVTPAEDFHSFISVWDPSQNWKLWVNKFTQEDLNRYDAQRTNSGQSWCVVPRDYSRSYQGTVAQPVQVDGSGPDPTSAGTYTGVNDALFTVEITTGGASGTAVFRWKKDGGSYTSSVTTDVNGSAQLLQEGVEVLFPTAQTYVLGDIWVIRVKAIDSAGLPRYELWPHQKASYVYPYLYEARATDLQDAGATLPRYIRGDMLLEGALAGAARWPGNSSEKPSAYYDLRLADTHEKRFERKVAEAERQDEEVNMQDLYYEALNMPFAPVPDSAWMQSHDV